MPTMTTAQALIAFLSVQRVERDGERHQFFSACLGIFGHGNLAGIGQALQGEAARMPFILARNEQGMVHTAAGFARERRRLGALVCTSSVGPGATNMVTGAALATINRLPVLLLPGDVFASRRPDPALQQLERFDSGEASVNDSLRAVSRYWDRIERPEQIIPAALAAMRVLTDPAETGAVTLALPQDVQTEALEVPEAFLGPRTWQIGRRPPESAAIAHAAELIREAQRPLIVAGGGVLYSDASSALTMLSDAAGIPVVETQAGRGSVAWDFKFAAGAVGATGTLAANRLAAKADLVIGIGTRWGDFTTASKTAFQYPDVRFININVCRPDAVKLSGLELLADARAAIEALTDALAGHGSPDTWQAEVLTEIAGWVVEADRVRSGPGASEISQAAIIGAVNDQAGREDVVVCAAGSLPGDLHKLWRSQRPGDYHVEYGYSCMGYEIAGGLGMKLASPEREIFVMVGDGSYLMLSSEIVTSVAEGLKLIIVLVDNGGFASIGALSRSLGSDGFGTRYEARSVSGPRLDSDGPIDPLPVDLAANAASLGAAVLAAATLAEFRDALAEARTIDRTVVVYVAADRFASVPAYESWWEVAVAEVSDDQAVTEARRNYQQARNNQRRYLDQPEGD